MKSETALLIINYGTPETARRRDVARYLRQLLDDKHVTNSPKGPVMMRVMGKNIPQIAIVASDIGTNSILVLTTAEYQRE